MQPDDTKVLLERFSSNENISPEARARELEIYRGAALWNNIMLSGSLVSAFAAATVCERPWPTIFALAATGATSWVAKKAREYMSSVEHKIRNNYPF